MFSEWRLLLYPTNSFKFTLGKSTIVIVMYACLCFFTMLSNPRSEILQSGARNFQQCFWPHTTFPNWPFDQHSQMENSPKRARWQLMLWARLRYFMFPPSLWHQLQTCRTSSCSQGTKWQREKCGVGRCPHILCHHSRTALPCNRLYKHIGKEHIFFLKSLWPKKPRQRQGE